MPSLAFGDRSVSSSRSNSEIRGRLLPAFLMFIMLGGSLPGVFAAPSLQAEPAAATLPVAQYNQDIEVNIGGQALYIYQSWNGFKEGAKPTDPPINVWGGIQSNASMKFTFSPIGQTVTGTMTGAYSDPGTLMNVSFAGTVTGVMVPEYWSAGRWLWDINATASIQLTFSWGNRTGPDTIVWTTKTIPISDEFKISALDRTDHTAVDFDIYWSDNGGINGGSRSFSMYATGDGFNATRFPVPLDFDYEISGPDAISTSTSSAQFNVQTTGEDADMVQNATWEFYFLNQYTQVWTLCSYSYPSAVGRVYKTDDSPLTVTGSTINSWAQILNQHGVSQLGNKVLPMRVMMTFCADPGGVQEMVAWEEWYNSTFDFLLQEQAVLSGQIGGMGLPMKHAKLEFKASGGGTYSGTADAGGRFTVPADASKSGAFTLSIIFAYQRDGTTYYTLHYKNTNPNPAADTTPPVSLDLSVSEGRVTAAIFRYSADKTEVVPVPEGKTVAGINLDDYMNAVNKLDFFVGMYNHFTEVLEFYKDYLGVDLTERAPLKVYTCVGKETAYDSAGSVSYITINEGISYEGSPTEPKNREYHEFSHYAMHCLYGNAFDYPEPASEYINHGGFINPTTIDSYQEAFAYFMSTMIGIHYGNYWDTYNLETSDSLGMKGSLDENFKVWEREGMAEEMAIAGTLWDLYDGGRETLNMEATAALAFFAEADLNNDSQIDRTEMLTLCLDASFKASYAGENGMFNSTHFEAMVQSNNWTQSEVEERLLERVGEEIAMIIPLLSVDVSKDDLIAAILQVADNDSSGSLDYSELWAEAPEGTDPVQFATTSLAHLDGDSDGYLRGNELAALGTKLIFDKYEPLHLNVIMSKYGASSLPDEDSVNLDFRSIWDVLKVPHRDFKSVYDLLISEFPQHEEGINAIFIAHGIYRIGWGNGNYDPGEPWRDVNGDGNYGQGDDFVDIGNTFWDENAPIGQASNYGRDQRRSLISFPGQFIRVNNSAPYYWMELTCIDPYADQGLPLKFHKTQLFNHNGSIYFPMPPQAYISEVRIYPADVAYGKPLFFTSSEFEESYLQAVQQGYFKQHDFQITGPVPPTPQPPGTDGSQPPANQTQSRCFIATATYGSEAAPQVQFLRDFRDGIAMQTFAGSNFMSAFLGWYYSWSPPVAYSIAPDNNARVVMRVALQPILDILQVATYTYSALSFNGEFAIVMAGFVAAALIGLIYIVPAVTLALLGLKRLKRGITLPGATQALRFTAIPWTASIALILIAELTLAPLLMMAATAAFVVLTIALTAGTLSLWLASFYRRR